LRTPRYSFFSLFGEILQRTAVAEDEFHRTPGGGKIQLRRRGVDQIQRPATARSQIDGLAAGVQQFDPLIGRGDGAVAGHVVKRDAIAALGIIPVLLRVGDNFIDDNLSMQKLWPYPPKTDTRRDEQAGPSPGHQSECAHGSSPF